MRRLIRNWLISQVALPMAQTTQMETRLAAILQNNRRQTMLHRKTLVIGTAAAFAVIMPLAALRPVAGAQTPLDTASAAPAVPAGKDAPASHREKSAFSKAVRQYNLAIARDYYTLADAISTHDLAVSKNQPKKLTPLLVPGYTLNGRKANAAQVVSLLRSRLREQDTGHHLMKLYTSVRPIPTRPPHPTTDQAAQRTPLPLPERFIALRQGRFGTAKHRFSGKAIFSLREVWVNTPRGWRLAASTVI